MMKKIISLLLVLVMLTGMLPVLAQAEEPETAVDNGEITVQGTNSFGSLLAEDIAQAQESMEEQENAGYTLTDLEITGNTATVTYDSLEEATVVVSIYTEDGMQLLTSGQATVIPEETTATVTIDGEMPQYFMASAYLLDSYDMSPLCPVYDTPLYTKEMQELLNSTAEDYDPDRVLQLEESPETNFAVYAETTKVIKQVEGVNTVATMDDETNTYVIENADENITSLQIGDVFSYAYGENELLIVKVATITVDGTTATITGGDLELQEAFSHVKIEGESGTEDLTVDHSGAHSAIAYDGVITEGNAARALTGDYTTTAYHQFQFKESLKEETSKLSASLEVTGSIKLKMAVSVNYYVSATQCYVEFKVTPEMIASLNMNGRIKGGIPLGTFGAFPIPGVFVGFDPEFVMSFSGTMGLTLKVTTTFGIRYDNKNKLQNISTAPDIIPSITVEAAFYLGIDFRPRVIFLDEKTFEIGMTAEVGVEIKAKLRGTDFELPDEKGTTQHSCKQCLDFTLTFKANLGGKISFLNSKWLSVDINIGKWNIPMGQAYYSLDNGDFGFGSCPNVKCRLTVTVIRSIVPVSGVNVTTTAGDELGPTNSNGVVIGYLPAGDYQLKAVIDGKTVTKKITVTKADSVKISASDSGSTGSSGSTTDSTTGKPNILDGIQAGTSDFQGFVDRGAVTASGTYGDNLTWVLYDSGTLYISGIGTMQNNEATTYPWYSKRSEVNTIVINEGVTSIGSYAFYEFSNLTSVDISDSVITIGGCAFRECTSLISVTLGNSVNIIGYYAFYGCSSLVSVTIPDSVTDIVQNAFYGCNNLRYNIYDNGKYIGNKNSPYLVLIDTISTDITRISIHAQTKIIWHHAFMGCGKLTSIAIPNSVISVGNSAFRDCSSLTSVTLPDSVTSVGSWAFQGCTSLTSVSLGNSVTRIETYTFNSCVNLTTVSIPDSITSIYSDAFSECSSLQYNTYDNGMYLGNKSNPYVVLMDTTRTDFATIAIHPQTRYIWLLALRDCNNLISLSIPDSVRYIDEKAFSGCSSLISLSIPDSIIGFGQNVCAGCNRLIYNTDDKGQYLGNEFNPYVVLKATTDTDVESFTFYPQTRIIGERAFYNCSNLDDVTLPSGLTYIGRHAFRNCVGLTNLTIPNSVTTIEESAFSNCTNLKDVYYTGTPAQWNTISIGFYNDALNNATIHYNSTVSTTMLTTNEMTVANGSLSGLIDGEMTSANAVFGGEYGTDVVDNVTVKTADFANLVPGKDYVLLSLASIDADDPLAADNLLFIDQAVADENGCLSFRYLQRVNTDLSYVMVCGASNKDLNDAQISFPRMTADSETQIVQPVVVYDGKTLIEGQDYVITGDVDFTEAGEYTCYIRGIYNYTGLVTCTYQVSKVTIPTLTLKAPTLEFKDMITVNAMFTAENIEDVVEMGMITYTDKVDSWSVETATHVIPGTTYDVNTGRYIAASQGIHAKYLGDTVYLAVYAQLTDGTYAYSKLAGYSPVQYATSKLKGTDTSLKQLVVAMLNYGAAAQTHFGHNTDALANGSLTADQIALPEAYRADMVAAVPAASAEKQGTFANNKGFAKRYPSISFEGAFCINYFFTPNYAPVDGITLYYWNAADYEAATVLTVENATGSVRMDGDGIGQYRGDIIGIAAKDLSKAIYVAAVYSDGTTTWTSGVLGYSIGAYCASQSTKGGTIADLAMATAVYGYQAKQYFN